jgi:multisubunit Na+/H+ antiporter MnhG subunit
VFDSFGKMLILMGAILILIGVLFSVGSKIGLGRLPGDIVYQKGNFTFYFPLMTSLLLSLLLTLLLWIFRK